MRVLAVIPARYGSTRFPGKPLALLQGKPVIQHVYEQVVKATSVDEVVVATDDDRIKEAVTKFRGVAEMTNPDAASGTERVAAVARTHRKAQVVINVQGDEPLIRPDMVDQLADYLAHHSDMPMASLMTPLPREDDGNDPNVVKVVVDEQGLALYFSRAPIPFIRERGTSPAPRLYKHLGIYGYQRDFVLMFPGLQATRLEQLEQLEQLRALGHGYQIKLLETVHDTVGVDTPEDLAKVEQRMARG